MSSYFLLRGRQALLREVCGAGVALTGGSLLFAWLVVRLSPTMGQDVAYGAALVVAAPTAVLLLQSIRNRRFRLPSLPTVPKGVPWIEYQKMKDAEKIPSFEAMDHEAWEGLQWLAGILAAKTLDSHFSVILGDTPRTTLPIRIDDTTIELDSARLMSGPEEFVINVGKDSKRKVLVKVNRSKREVQFMVRDVTGNPLKPLES